MSRRSRELAYRLFGANPAAGLRSGAPGDTALPLPLTGAAMDTALRAAARRPTCHVTFDTPGALNQWLRDYRRPGDEITLIADTPAHDVPILA